MSQIHISKFFALGCALISIVMACMVLYGWHTLNQSLVQVSPHFAPMQFNTALGFLLCGVGLILVVLKMSQLAKLAGLIVFSLGLATLAEYVFNTDFSIDNFFVEPVFLTKTSHPGRMAPNTALCFSILGLALLFGTHTRRFSISALSAVLALSIISLLGYFIEYETLYGWGNLTRMAIHTASCFIILSLGGIAYSYFELKKQKFDYWQLAPSMISLIVAVLVLFSWYVIDEEAHARNKSNFENLVEKTQDVILDEYVLYEEALRGGLGLFQASESVQRDEWNAYVNALKLNEFLPSINGMGYIDLVLEDDLKGYLNVTREDGVPDFNNHPKTDYNDKFIIKYIEPIDKNIQAVGLDIGFESNRRKAAERARDEATPALTQKITLVQDSKKEAGFLLLIPFYETNFEPDTIEERRKYIKGWVYAPFIAPNFFSGTDKINENQLSFTVYDGTIIAPENIIYSSSSKEMLNAQDTVTLKTSMTIAGQVWTMIWHPSAAYINPSNEKMANIFLIFGLIFAFILYLALSRLLNSKQIIARQVDLRTHELQKTEQSLRLANEELEEFAYRTSHDLRSPLVSSIGLLKLTEEAVINQDKDAALETINHVKTSLTKLEILVKDILALTQTKNAEEDRQVVDIENIIDDALNTFSNMDNFDKISVTKKLDYTKDIYLKKTRLTLIVENLISNAIKYQDTKKEKSTLELSTFKQAGNFVFKVQDNGLGIPKEQQDKMFMMFKRFHNRVAFGSGLGLYMMKKSAHILEGDIVYEDTAEGSIFKLIIPLSNIQK